VKGATRGHQLSNAHGHSIGSPARWRDHARMPPTSPTPNWLPPAACRAMAYQEGERAKKLQNHGMRGPIEKAARRYEALADKLEAARKKAGA
jgi:hypothetical protein